MKKDLSKYRGVNTKFKIENSMADDEIMLEIELGIDSSKYGDDPVVLNVQAYWGDEGDRMFGGNGSTTSRNGNPVIIRKVKLAKERNKKC